MTIDRDTDAGESVGTPTDEQLASRLAELEDAVRELRDRSRRPPRGPLGMPRPPTPREFMEFTDRYAIPATIAFLEANIRALQALQATLRMTRNADEAGDRASEARKRTAELGAKTLDALDAALQELQDAYRDGPLPSDPESRSILQEAQKLTDEIRDELRDTTGTRRRRSSSRRGESRTRGEATKDPRVDPTEVETELEMLRDQYETTQIDVMGPTDEDDITDDPGEMDDGTGTEQPGGPGETNSVDGRHEREDEPEGADLDDDRDEADVPDEFFEDDEDDSSVGESDGNRGS